MQTQIQSSAKGPMPKGFGTGEPFRQTIVGAPAYIVSNMDRTGSIWGTLPK